ncbi:MAG TPA: hypothetical protein ENO29_02435 [Candidatus Aminicenantes bacterium]|nr:MAG: hypothetical protein C0168_04250 [Candidatus Aminicenantes bacterium]HEK85202.1 hypothetical protein [Candidatus Aminicenantes bacterium]
MIKKLLCLITILAIFHFPSYADLKKVVSIGSDDINYRFFGVAGAVLDDQGNVYICDSKGSFLRKYDSDGKFIKEIGRYGQGPGEFSNTISGLYLCDGLFVLDTGNNRIVELDQELNIRRYIKLSKLALSIMGFSDNLYMISRTPGRFSFEVGVYDRNGNYIKSFFDRRPVFIERIEQSKIGQALSLIYSSIAATVERETGEVAITFQWPGENIEIFRFSKDGEFIKKIVSDHIIKYDFPEFRLKGLPTNLRFPDQSNLIMIRSIHSLDEKRLLLEYWVNEYNLDKVVKENEYILIVDRNSGQLVHRELLPLKSGIADARKSYICAISNEGDVPEVVIYRLDY